jgi:hypothetical protein
MRLFQRMPARAKSFSLLFAALAALASAPAHAGLDEVQVQAGNGDHVDVVGVNLGGSAGWQQRALGINWDLRWRAQAEYWNAQANAAVGTTNKNLTLVGAMPVLRASLGDPQTAPLFLDLGIGGNVISRTSIGNRTLSTGFQFGELIGAGYAFGERRQYEILARAEHVSNADIKRPNAGLTFFSVGLGYHF